MTKYKLAVPVEYDGEQLTEIECKRPKGRHLKHLSAEPSLPEMIMIAVSATGFPRKVFEDLDGYDYVKIGEIYGGFLEVGPIHGNGT